MTITYQWNIQQLNCIPEIQGEVDFVVTAHWTVSATDGTYSSSAYGTQGFTYNGGANFTPFSELTQDQVVGWVQEGMGIDAVVQLQQSLDTQIANQINPPIVSPTLPWVSNTTPDGSTTVTERMRIHSSGKITIGSTVAGNSSFRIDSSSDGGANAYALTLSGTKGSQYIRRIAYYDQRLPNAQLQSLTGG